MSQVSKEEDKDRLELIRSMSQLLLHIQTNPESKEDIFNSFHSNDISKLLSNFESQDKQLRKVSALFFCQLLHCNLTNQERFCDLLGLSMISGGICLNPIQPEFKSALVKFPSLLLDIQEQSQQTIIQSHNSNPICWFITLSQLSENNTNLQYFIPGQNETVDDLINSFFDPCGALFGISISNEFTALPTKEQQSSKQPFLNNLTNKPLQHTISPLPLSFSPKNMSNLNQFLELASRRQSLCKTHINTRNSTTILVKIYYFFLKTKEFPLQSKIHIQNEPYRYSQFNDSQLGNTQKQQSLSSQQQPPQCAPSQPRYSVQDISFIPLNEDEKDYISFNPVRSSMPSPNFPFFSSNEIKDKQSINTSIPSQTTTLQESNPSSNNLSYGVSQQIIFSSPAIPSSSSSGYNNNITMMLNNIPPVPDERMMSTTTGINPLDSIVEKENHSANQSNNLNANKNNKYFVCSEQRNSKPLNLQLLDQFSKPSTPQCLTLKTPQGDINFPRSSQMQSRHVKQLSESHISRKGLGFDMSGCNYTGLSSVFDKSQSITNNLGQTVVFANNNASANLGSNASMTNQQIIQSGSNKQTARLQSNTDPKNGILDSTRIGSNSVNETKESTLGTQSKSSYRNISQFRNSLDSSSSGLRFFHDSRQQSQKYQETSTRRISSKAQGNSEITHLKKQNVELGTKVLSYQTNWKQATNNGVLSQPNAGLSTLTSMLIEQQQQQTVEQTNDSSQTKNSFSSAFNNISNTTKASFVSEVTHKIAANPSALQTLDLADGSKTTPNSQKIKQPQINSQIMSTKSTQNTLLSDNINTLFPIGQSSTSSPSFQLGQNIILTSKENQQNNNHSRISDLKGNLKSNTNNNCRQFDLLQHRKSHDIQTMNSILQSAKCNNSHDFNNLQDTLKQNTSSLKGQIISNKAAKSISNVSLQIQQRYGGSIQLNSHSNTRDTSPSTNILLSSKNISKNANLNIRETDFRSPQISMRKKMFM